MRRVIHRELRRIWRQPRYLVILTLGIILSFVFFATLMNEGQPQNLPVAVVDMDHSYLSRRVCHEMNATQGVHVVAVYDNHTEARKAMQRGEIFAFYEIPKGTYNEVLQFHAPHFGLYTNTAYLLAGSLSYRQLATLGMLAAGAVQREVLRKKGFEEEQIMGLIQPIELDTHPIGNPWTSYRIYLMTTLFPAIVAFIVLLHTVYLIGRERQERTLRNWMNRAGGNGLKAVTGKFLPYTLWYSLLTLTGNLLMFGPMHFPFEGSWPALVLTTLLLIAAAQSAGIFIACSIDDPPLSMGVTAVYGALSFSLSGFSFPVESMPRLFESLSWLYPIRHYYLAYRDIAVFGNGFGHYWPHLCALLLFGLPLLAGAFMLNKQCERSTHA
ncbi:MAG: ABC transporter permease [Bacteroidales bacterium]|nr:ABC transporter permease [Bacteroidales bacterium]